MDVESCAKFLPARGQNDHRHFPSQEPIYLPGLAKNRLSLPQKPAHSSEPVEQKAKIISAEEFTNKISKQKQRIALLQDAIDKLQGSIQYVQNNRNVYVNAPEYNQAQKYRQAEVDELRGRLEGAKNDLSDLQEQARQAGYGSAVYQ